MICQWGRSTGALGRHGTERNGSMQPQEWRWQCIFRQWERSTALGRHRMEPGGSMQPQERSTGALGRHGMEPSGSMHWRWQ